MKLSTKCFLLSISLTRKKLPKFFERVCTICFFVVIYSCGRKHDYRHLIRKSKLFVERKQSDHRLRSQRCFEMHNFSGQAEFSIPCSSNPSWGGWPSSVHTIFSCVRYLSDVYILYIYTCLHVLVNCVVTPLLIVLQVVILKLYRSCRGTLLRLKIVVAKA